jgi:hypothetical protein
VNHIAGNSIKASPGHNPDLINIPKGKGFMTLQASVLSSPSPLNAIFDLLSPKASVQEVAVVVSVVSNQQEEQAAERQYLVSRINDLCDCV